MKSMGDLLKRAIGQSEKLPPKYWTEGWNKFSFLMTPEQVKEVFEAYHLIIINSSVPIDYVESELSEYLSAYSETYKQLCSGEKVTTCSLDLWRGITSNLARCRYGEIKTDEPRTLDFSGVRGFLVTNVCIVQRSAA